MGPDYQPLDGESPAEGAQAGQTPGRGRGQACAGTLKSLLGVSAFGGGDTLVVGWPTHGPDIEEPRSYE